MSLKSINWFYSILGVACAFFVWGIVIFLSHGWGWFFIQVPLIGGLIGLIIGAFIGQFIKKPNISRENLAIFAILLIPLMLALPIATGQMWLKSLATDLPIPPEAEKITAESAMHAEGYEVQKQYKTTMSMEELIAFFQSELSNDGWLLTYSESGNIFEAAEGNGGSTYRAESFGKGEYSLVVEMTDLPPGSDILYDPPSKDTVWFTLTLLVPELL